MARISKEQQIHLDGMGFAYRIAKSEGVEALEKEMKWRGVHDMPLNVNHRELTQLARIRAKDELRILSMAMAETMSVDMKLPPSVIVDFLRKFNARIELYRYDKPAMEQAQHRLDSMYSLNETLKKFIEED